MANTKKPMIYESPDGGLTIRAREIGDAIENTVTISSNDVDMAKYPGWQLERQTKVFNDHVARLQLIEKYPDLKESWNKFCQLEQEYKAWDLLNRK